jgi:hypothetical protein
MSDTLVKNWSRTALPLVGDFTIFRNPKRLQRGSRFNLLKSPVITMPLDGCLFNIESFPLDMLVILSSAEPTDCPGGIVDSHK